MATPEPQTSRGAASRFPCSQCGAALEYAPGTKAIACGYCAFENEVPEPTAEVVEHDFEQTLASLGGAQETQEALDIACDSCGAKIHGLEQRTSTRCAFCDAPVVATRVSSKLIKPNALLPFKIDKRRAADLFLGWLGKLWFAPSDLKKAAQVDGRLNGLYIPAWTFDSRATTAYTGQRGDAYYVSVSYTATVNGRPVRKTRQERRIRWSSASGTVHDRFDDVLVLASDSLPKEMARELEPWDLPALVPYADEYLSGFGAESYQVDLRAGFDIAQGIMRRAIEMSVRRDIGGDEQRIASLSTRHSGVTYKHILLPVWVAAYRYRGKVFRFLVNARTGEVRGQRPYSASKIAAAVALALAAIGVIVLVLTLRR